jgi:hypothetical protein
MPGLLWLILAHTIQLAVMEIVKSTKILQVALMNVQLIKNNVQPMANTNYVETMTATLVWNGPPTTPAQQDRPVEAVEYAKALALISAQ